MTDPIVVYVAGTPRPQPRPRFVNGRVVSTGSKIAKMYRAQVRGECALVTFCQGVHHGPVDLNLELFFRTADLKKVGTPHTSRPDGDNVLKLWQDCAEQAGLLPKGDAKVAKATVTKWWSAKAGAQMTIRPFEPHDDGEIA